MPGDPPSDLPGGALGLYLHFPWCVRKCPYCDFNSHALRGEVPEADYVAALLRDLDADLESLGDRVRPASSAFLGGGTPSLFSGAAIGMVFLAAKPWFPTPVSILSTVYQRANMIASGKMFVANSLTPAMLAVFDWNPLFHTIDQARGAAFVNYFPRNSNWEYALWVSIVLLMIGLMGEFYTRRHASASWGARR